MCQVEAEAITSKGVSDEGVDFAVVFDPFELKFGAGHRFEAWYDEGKIMFRAVSSGGSWLGGEEGHSSLWRESCPSSPLYLRNRPTDAIQHKKYMRQVVWQLIIIRCL